jgi:hypothetical protein
MLEWGDKEGVKASNAKVDKLASKIYNTKRGI